MNNVLVTGANGFLGYYLIQQLLQQNYNVIGTGKGECRLPFSDEKFMYHSMDFSIEDQVMDVLQKYQPAIIIHGGAMSRPDECELNKELATRTNVTGTENLLKYAAVNKCF